MTINKYFITPNNNNLDKNYLENIFKKHTKTNKIDFVCLRCDDNVLLSKTRKQKNLLALKNLKKDFAQICLKYKRKNKIKYVFFKDIKTAKKYKGDGVHLKSYDSSKIKQVKRAKMQCIISCHNQKDIKKAIINGSDYITYSPIFKSKGANGCGLRMLKKIIKKYKQINFFALGGIVSIKQAKLLDKLNQVSKKPILYGFASIRYFA